MSEAARHTPGLAAAPDDGALHARRRTSGPLAPMQGLLMAVLLSSGLWALIILGFRALS